MVLDSLLAYGIQLRGVPDVDCLPASELRSYLRDYLISCRVDGMTWKTLKTYRDSNGYSIESLSDVCRDLPPTQPQGINFGCKALRSLVPAMSVTNYLTLPES